MEIEFEKNYKEVSVGISYDWMGTGKVFYVNLLFWNVSVWF